MTRAADARPSVFARILEALSAFGLVFSQLRHALERGADAFLRKAELLFILYLWVSAGAMLAVLGLLDLLVQFTALPRGAILLAGGVLVSLAALLAIRLTQSKDCEP